MSGLPPWVIEREKTPEHDRASWLGLNGWTSLRSAALSFQFPAEAEEWMAAQRKSYPKMWANVTAEVKRVTHAPRDNFGRMIADYDPFAADGRL
jgi:hypothetical protein